MRLGKASDCFESVALGGTSTCRKWGKLGMSGDILATPVAKKRNKALWIGVATFVVIGAIVVFALVLRGGGQAPDAATSTPTPTVTATPAPAAPPTEAGELADDQALATIEAALAAPIASVGTSADLEALLKDVAVDSYAAELEAQWQELLSQGWTIKGAPTLVSSEVTSLDSKSSPPTAEVSACIDSSAVSILDAAGAPIGDESAKTPRALHLFTLVQGSDDIWRIASHSFPNDPTCKPGR